MRAPAYSGDLQGWKEIAGYLGKSVRAVQRWEREMGLPVRRLKTPAGQVIFARRDEIEAWRAGQEIPRPPAASAPHQPAAPDAVRPASSPGPRRHAPWATAALACAVMAVAAVAFVRPSSSSPAPVRFDLTDDALVATDGQGHQLWRHVFPAALRVIAGDSVRTRLDKQVQVVDLDADGIEEVLALVGYDHTKGVRADELYCFSRTGELRWKFAPDHALAFHSERFGPPWYLTDVVVSRNAGRRDVWVSTIHNTWWPSAVFRLSPAGEPEIRFIQSGAVYALGFWEIGGVTRLVASGLNNEYAAASLAILPLDGPAAASPQTAGSKYACHDCPTGRPLSYVLFPRSELNRASDLPYNKAVAFNVFEGSLLVHTREVEEIPASTWMYRLSQTLELEDAAPGDTYWVAHRRYEQLRRVDHTTHECRARTARIRVFDSAAGWKGTAARTATMPLPGSSGQ